MMKFSLRITCSRQVDPLLTTAANPQGFRHIFSYLGLFWYRFVEYICTVCQMGNMYATMRLELNTSVHLGPKVSVNSYSKVKRVIYSTSPSSHLTQIDLATLVMIITTSLSKNPQNLKNFCSLYPTLAWLVSSETFFSLAYVASS